MNMSRREMLACVGAFAAAPVQSQGSTFSGYGNETRAAVFPFDGTVDIAGSRPEVAWPAYRKIEHGHSVLIPFSPTLTERPMGYHGDFYAKEFTDEKIRAAWSTIRGITCKDRDDALKYAAAFGGPNEFRMTGLLDKGRRFSGVAERDIRDVRRPADFARAPYSEPIAALENVTTTIELAVRTDANDQRLLGARAPHLMRIRGWHIRGDGVPLPNGGRRRALAIILGGRGSELTAFQNPQDLEFFMRMPGRIFVPGHTPTQMTENIGARHFRECLASIRGEGFDVLATDLRGHGVSDGVNGSNAFQQGMDVLRLLEALDSGEGLRILAPDGTVLTGKEAADRTIEAPARTTPTVLIGNSQGTMVASYVMHANFVSRRAFDRQEGTEDVPSGFDIRGAAMLAEYVKGPGYGYQVHWDGRSRRNSFLAEAALRSDFGIAFAPTSEILAGVSAWPAIFLGRGLWDSAGALAGTLDVYRRARGLREIVVVRGPHGLSEAGAWNEQYVWRRVRNFARLAVGGIAEPPGRPPIDLRDLVLSSPSHWGAFMAPDAKSG